MAGVFTPNSNLKMAWTQRYNMPLLTLLMPLVNTIFSFIPNPAQRAEQMQQLMTALQQWDAQQSQTNTAEAQNTNVFVSGWRPMIGWVCAFATAYQYIIIPFATWGFAIAHMVVPAMPKLDENLWQLTFGMLGMSGLRTIEKLQGKASK